MQTCPNTLGPRHYGSQTVLRSHPASTLPLAAKAIFLSREMERPRPAWPDQRTLSVCCLAFKHIPLAIRTKLDAHASPVVYLGIDPKSRSYLLGSLYDLNLSVS